MDTEARDKAAREYANKQEGESEGDIDRLICKADFSKGWDAALARVQEMARERQREVCTITLADIERICGGGHE